MTTAGRLGQSLGPASNDPSAAESRAWRPSLSYLAIAAGLIAVSLAYWWASSPVPVLLPDDTAAPLPVAANRSAPTAAPLHAAAAASTPARTVPPPTVSRMRDPNGDLTPDLRDYLNAGEKPTMNEVLDRLHQAGVRTGIGAFSPPGTKPTLIGLAVPEDFALPDGYVRHHQTTDDGQPIEPILMYAPDRQFLDAAGQPIAIPKNRVVPPELAPAGLPIRRIVIPAPTEPDKPGT